MPPEGDFNPRHRKSAARNRLVSPRHRMQPPGDLDKQIQPKGLQILQFYFQGSQPALKPLVPIGIEVQRLGTGCGDCRL